MCQTLRILLFLLFLLTGSNAASVAVLYTEQDDSEITTGIVEELNKNSTASASLIRSTYDISKALSHKPDLILLVSDASIKNYLKFASQKNSSTPMIALCSIDSYQTFRRQLPQSQFCVTGTATNEHFRKLSKITRTIYPSAGFLYYPSVKQEISFEMSRLRQAGISPFTRLVRDSSTADNLKKAILSLSGQGTTAIRLALSDSMYALLTQDSELPDLLEKRFSVILTDRNDLYTFFPKTPVLTIVLDKQLYSKTVALISTVSLFSSVQQQDLTICAQKSALHIGDIHKKDITEPSTILMEQFDVLLLEAGKTLTGKTLQELVYQSISPIVETGVKTSTEQFLQMTEAGTGLDTNLFLSITIRDLMIFGSSLTLVGIAINILMKFIASLTTGKALAIVYPSKAINTKVERVNKRPKSLEKVLHSEKFAVKPIATLMQYRSFLKKKTADLHVIEWNNGSDVIIYLQHIFDNREPHRTEPVIIMNISKKFQMELAPRFSKTPLYLFENAPTLEDLERVFYGSGHQEYHVSSISGILSDKSLPQILQTLESSCLTGALLIEDPQPFSIIFYNNGLIVYAQDRFGSSTEEAIFHSLEKKDGSFRFEKNRRSPVQKAALNSMDVLIAWSAKNDGLKSE